MGLVETVKDVAELVQKSDKVELLRQVLSLQKEAMIRVNPGRSGRIYHQMNLLCSRIW